MTAMTTTNETTNTNGDNNPPRQLTAIAAIQKITKLLDQLSPSDRKRVLAFINVGGEEGDE